MSLEHILLGFLQQSQSGYELKSATEQSTAYFWPAELSQIYRTLRQLERRGLLRSETTPSTRGPERRVYSLTPAGREQLREWLTDEPVFGDERFTYLAQVFFMGAANDLAHTRRFVEQMRSVFQQRLTALRAIEKAHAAARGAVGAPPSSDEFHRLLTLRMGLHRNAASVRWCEETLDAIDARMSSATPARRRRSPR